MSANLRMYTTIVFGLEHVVRLVPHDAWEHPSPCEGWAARELAGHAMGVVNNVAARAGVGDNVDVFGDVGAIAGSDPLESFRAIRDRFLEATDRPGALRTVISSSLGEMTIDDYIAMMCSDTLVHTWDLAAAAAGVDRELDPAAVRAVYAGYLARDESALRTPGRYDAAVDIAGDSSEQDRLIAFTGRDPRWTA